MFTKGTEMTRYDNTIELPVDAEEAVKALQRELRDAKRRLADSRHAMQFAAYRGHPVGGSNVGGRS